MLKLQGLRIKVTTYEEDSALQSFFAYTLPNTPFYFKLIWRANIPEDYKNKFSQELAIWDLGDGTVKTGKSIQHYYKWPGKYNVNVKIVDVEGNTHTLYPERFLEVFNAVPDMLTMGGLEVDGSTIYSINAGRRTKPLKFLRFNSWQSDEYLKEKQYTVNLHVSGNNSFFISSSAYYTSQWAHLRPYCGFIERSISSENVVQEKIIDNTITTSTKIYAEKINTGRINGNWNIRLDFYGYPKEGAVFCGTSGTELPGREIYFVDQKPSSNKRDDFTVIYASIDNNAIFDKDTTQINSRYGIINNIWSAQFLKTLYNPACALAITSNGITFEGGGYNTDISTLFTFDIYPIKYTNTVIPFVVTIKDAEYFTTKCYNNLTLNNTSKLKVNEINVSLVEVLSENQYKPVDNFFVTTNKNLPSYLEGDSYFAGLLSCTDDVRIAQISATAFILDDIKPPPNKNSLYIMQPGANVYRRFNRLLKYGYVLDNKTFNVVDNGIYSTMYGDVSGGINITYVPGYTVDPLSGEYVWIANADRDKIICHDGDGNSRFEISLRRLPALVKGKNGQFRRVTINALGADRTASPCNIAVNSNGDAWVTLYDSVTSFRLDKNTGVAAAFALPLLDKKTLETSYGDSTFYAKITGLKGFVGENLILPTSVDVDRQDNVYISYTHPLCSFVTKYNNEGEPLRIIPFSFPFTVKQLIVDLNDNVWLTALTNDSIDSNDSPQSQKITERSDRIYVIDQQNNKLVFTDISMPGDLTMDADGYIWVNSRINTISKLIYNGNDIEKIDFVIGTENNLNYIQDIGGMAGDFENNIILLNNTESTIMYFNSRTVPVSSNLDPRKIPSTLLVDASMKDAVFKNFLDYKTIGDFTGLRWYLKNRRRSTNFPRYISGLSTPFTLKKYDSIEVVKKNENYNLTETLKSYVLQESLFNNTNLFDNFLEPILTGPNYSLNELGKVIYEKISNYVDNISDVDRCNINSLKSMYSMLGENLDTFANTLPPGLRRITDLLSIKRCVLFGIANSFNKNFNLVILDEKSNIGNKIEVSTGKFLPGYPIIVYDKFTKKYKVIQNTLVSESDIIPMEPYPLSGVKYDWGWGLVLNNKNDDYRNIDGLYSFYEYKAPEQTDFYDGVLDLKDELSNITPYISSYSDWTKFGGQMDSIISSNLYQCLGLISP